MATATVNGLQLHYELAGQGDPLVLVHGSWVDHMSWDLIAPPLSESFRVLSYDRRGHSRSERPAGQGSVREDVADLATLVEQLDLAPAHILGNSFGASITLRLAGERPELFRSLIAHEPPLFALLVGDPAMEEVQRRIAAVVELVERGEHEAGAERFVDTVAFEPGAWRELPPEMREVFVHNASTMLDEARDPEALTLDLGTLGAFPRAALITDGDQSPPFFPAVVEHLVGALPRAERRTLTGVGHVPQLTHADDYVALVREFAAAA